jgi:hypothetical protein
MARRKRTPRGTETEVLVRSRRRCCLCFGLEGDLGEKEGQIAHLDRDPSNADMDNLAWMCFRHHDRYDSRTSQSKGLTVAEAKRYRDELYEVVKERGIGRGEGPGSGLTEVREVVQVGRPRIEVTEGGRSGEEETGA